MLLLFCFFGIPTLFFTWAMVPGNLGLSFASAPYFFQWLTKYPNFGPIHLMVGLGILCKFFSSILPAIFAIYWISTSHKKKRWSYILFFTNLIFYVPVFVELDLMLWYSGLFGIDFLGIQKVFERSVLIGPILHLLSITSVAMLTVFGNQDSTK